MSKPKEEQLRKSRYLHSLFKSEDFQKYFLSDLGIIKYNATEVVGNPDSGEKEIRVAQGKLQVVHMIERLFEAASSRLKASKSSNHTGDE